MQNTTHSPLLEPDVRISRIRLSRKLSPQGYQSVAQCSRILQAETFEVSVVTHILRLPKASLAASIHVLRETV
jgi:hypothetical protein